MLFYILPGYGYPPTISLSVISKVMFPVLPSLKNSLMRLNESKEIGVFGVMLLQILRGIDTCLSHGIKKPSRKTYLEGDHRTKA
jgi:hypothetical protein